MDTRRLADQLEHLAQRLRTEGQTTDRNLAEWTAGQRSQLAGTGGGTSELTPTEAAALHPASTDRLRTRWLTNLRTLERTARDTERILDAARPQRTDRTAANNLEAANTCAGYCPVCEAAGFNPKGDPISTLDWHDGTASGRRLEHITTPRQTAATDENIRLCGACRQAWTNRPDGAAYDEWAPTRITWLTRKAHNRRN